MTVDDVIREFNRIKDEFGGDLEVLCYDNEMYYQLLKQINVIYFTNTNGESRHVVCLDTI